MTDAEKPRLENCADCYWSIQRRIQYPNCLESVWRECHYNPPHDSGFKTVRDDDFCREFRHYDRR